jgi:hypothetical protein
VPAITPAAPGKAVVTAAGLVLVIKAHPAPSTGPNGLSGTPGGPSAVHLACTLPRGQNATLATVLVTGRPSRHPAHHVAAKSPCPPLPKGGLKLNPRFPPPPPPPGSTVGSSPEAGCAYTTGFPDVRKLKGAALLQPALTNVDLFVKTAFNSGKANYAQFDNAAELLFHGKHEFPPSTATFLTFGFVPTTATLVLKEIGTINIFAIGPEDATRCHPPGSCPTIATVSSRLQAQISPIVKINGVPLNVGTRCQTSPFDAILTGSSGSNPPYIVTTGGPLIGNVTIPHFTNCGVGENLDPIFNAAISGPRNFNLLTQGTVCFLLGGGTCPPPKPTPLRKVSG